MQGRHIALQTAVAFNGDKAALGAKALALVGNDLNVLCVDLGHDHGHIRGKAVGAVVGNNGALSLRIGFFQSADLVFFHIYCAEDKIDLGCHFFYFGGIHYDHFLYGFGHGRFHSPLAANGFLVGLSGRAGRSGNHFQIKPGMVFHQSYKTLANHTGSTYNTNFVLFHFPTDPFFINTVLQPKNAG